MHQEELKAYQRLNMQGAFLFMLPSIGLVIAGTKLTNLTVTSPVWILGTTAKYLNKNNCIPEDTSWPNIQKQQSEYYHWDMISERLSEVIIFRPNWLFDDQYICPCWI